MGPERPVLFRAKVVLPVAREPIDDGAVRVAGDRILDVGRWKTLRPSGGEDVLDLGEVILLPGLINAHCHLDYTGLAGQISPPKGFSDWVKALLALKAHWSYSDFAQSWIQGAQMLLRRGVTTVADIEAVPELLPEVRSATPLRVCSFIEMTGVRSRRPAREILQEALDKIASLPAEANWAGLSPHALYSTTPELLQVSSEAARTGGWLVATHLAESAEEFEMYTSGSGPMFDWLEPQRDMSDCGHGSPVLTAQRRGLLGEGFLAVHVNYLAEGDAPLLAESRASVVHCPRSRRYFGHRPFPRQELEAAGVNICLGTDSLASVRQRRREKLELDLFAEMRALTETDHGVAPETVLRMATVNAAQALGRRGKLGELSPGAFADLITIPSSANARRACEEIVHHTGLVRESMINGRWAIAS